MNGSAWSIFILFLRHIFGNIQFKLNFESFVCQLKMKRDWLSLLTKPISDVSKYEKTLADSDPDIFIGQISDEIIYIWYLDTTFKTIQSSLVAWTACSSVSVAFWLNWSRFKWSFKILESHPKQWRWDFGSYVCWKWLHIEVLIICEISAKSIFNSVLKTSWAHLNQFSTWFLEREQSGNSFRADLTPFIDNVMLSLYF